jgi:hypothetical protein
VLAHPAALGSPVEIDVVLDGERLDVRPLRLPRPDVAAENPLLAPFNPRPGFDVPLLADGLEPGPHVVECTARCGEHVRPLGRAGFRVPAHATAGAGP